MNSETQRAYLAGLTDGEGNVTIGLIPARNGTTRHTLDVRITNTNIATLRQLAQEWDGSVVGIRSRNKARGWKEVGDLRWCTQRAAQMLSEVRPYLRMKAAQADIALAFVATLRPREHRTRPITPEEWAYREGLRLQMRALNQRGGTAEATAIPVPVKPTLVCQYCGAEFNSYQKLRKYCSRKCAVEAGRDAYVDRHTYEKECPACGRTFTARLKQQYCSISCGRKMQAPPVPRGTRRHSSDPQGDLATP